ncbi:MAG TPA: nucleotide exchange factor GrpE [Bacteroidales bacterium]|nr:nucleotide exchange factor GrpE [Bacteroidales bacterium]HQK37580.1 nucleotide exchange factor GrpE [Bacteroidales bacterium]
MKRNKEEKKQEGESQVMDNAKAGAKAGTENMTESQSTDLPPAETVAEKPVMEAEITEKEAEKEETRAEPSPEEQLAALQDKYLRLAADFDNYRKRMLKERMELIKTAGEDVLVSFLPILDDVERAMKSIRESQDLEAVKTGVELIYSKLKDFLTQKGIKEIDALHQPFNTDLHEAITQIPVDDQEKKGKVVDVVQKGYTLHDKIVRFPKVVVGE